MELVLAALSTVGIAFVAFWLTSLAKSARADRAATVNADDDDTAVEDDIGEWLHERLMERFGLETEAWAIERIALVTARLNAAREPKPVLTAEILWTQEMTAFIPAGHYLYVSRELLQRTASDDPAALCIAHEMAHHDLGHTRVFQGQWEALRHIPHTALLAALPSLVTARIYSFERESAADDYAMDLCVQAGYDPGKCLELFDILEANLLDHGDIDGVFGRDPAQPSENPIKNLWSHASEWHADHEIGYAPLRERRDALKQRIAKEKT